MISHRAAKTASVFTPNQLGILTMAAQGLSYSAMAARTDRSPRTISNTVELMLRHTGCANITQLVVYAICIGELPLPELMPALELRRSADQVAW